MGWDLRQVRPGKFRMYSTIVDHYLTPPLDKSQMQTWIKKDIRNSLGKNFVYMKDNEGYGKVFKDQLNHFAGARRVTPSEYARHIIKVQFGGARMNRRR
jgi:hypothetical protein